MCEAGTYDPDGPAVAGGVCTECPAGRYKVADADTDLTSCLFCNPGVRAFTTTVDGGASTTGECGESRLLSCRHSNCFCMPITHLVTHRNKLQEQPLSMALNGNLVFCATVLAIGAR